MNILEYLTVKEAADMADVTTARIRQVRIAGRFPGAVLRGGSWFIPESDLKDWMAKRRKGRPKLKDDD